MRNVTDKTYKDYNYTSRYSAFPYYYNKSDDKYFHGLTAYLDNTTVYQVHTVEYGDTLDSIALKYYNNPTYYWILCSFNHIQDPYVSLKPGTTLKIPSMSNIQYDFEGRD